MPTNKAPCPVCAESVRTDFLPSHIAKHTDLISHVMPIDSRKGCVENRMPFFYEKTGKTFKFCVCLVCKKGKTFLNNGSVESFITSHKHSKACCDAFDSVKDLYCLDATVVPVVSPIEYMSKPSNNIMELLYRTFGLSDADKALPMDDQLMKVVLSHQKLEAMYQKRQINEAKHTSSLEEDMRIAEQERLAILESRRKEDAERFTAQHPPENTIEMVPVKSAEPPSLEVRGEPVLEIQEKPKEEVVVKKVVKKLTTVKTVAPVVAQTPPPENITVVVSPAPKKLIRKVKTIQNQEAPKEEEAEPEPEPEKETISEEGQRMIYKLYDRIQTICDEEMSQAVAQEEYYEQDDEIAQYEENTKEKNVPLQDLKNVYEAWTYYNADLDDLKTRAEQIIGTL